MPLIGTRTTVFMGTYRIDDLSVWATLILAPATALGALVLAGAGDTMLLVLGILLASLGAFALVAYPRDDRATEAALKYLVFDSVASAALIYGLTFWYGATGATLLADLGRLASGPLSAAGLLAVLVGLGYKAALAPFHF